MSVVHEFGCELCACSRAWYVLQNSVLFLFGSSFFFFASPRVGLSLRRLRPRRILYDTKHGATVLPRSASTQEEQLVILISASEDVLTSALSYVLGATA